MEGIIQKEDLLFGLRHGEGYLHFYESIDMPGYYLIVEYGDDAFDWYDSLNRKGYYDDSNLKEWKAPYGGPMANVALPISIGIFTNNFRWRFLDYIKENYVIEHILDKQNALHEKGWFRIEKLELEKWLEEFIKYLKQKEAEYEYKNDTPTQLSLF